MTSWLIFFGAYVSLLLLGRLVVYPDRKYFSSLEKVAVFPMLGFVVTTLGLYIVSYLNLRGNGFIWLMLIAVLTGTVATRPKLLKPVKLKLKQSWLILVTIALGVGAQMFLVWPNGFVFPEGVTFFGVNAHDGMWHVALMRTLSQPFPPLLPNYSGTTISGYHFFVDLFGSELVSRFGLSPFDLTFRMLPLFFSIHTGLAGWALMKRLTNSRIGQFLGVFLTYFGGSLGFLLWFLFKSDSGETAFWAQQSVSTFVNLPLGAAFAVLAAAIVMLMVVVKESRAKWLWLVTGLMMACLLPIKSYGGILALAALAVVTVFQIWKTKHWFPGLGLVVSVLTALLLVFPSLKSGSGLFILEPGQMVRLMMESPDRLNFPRWETMRLRWVETNNYPGLGLLWTLAIGVFIVGNLSVRMVGFLKVKQLFKENAATGIFLGVIIVAGILMPLLFMQRGTGWNTIQFMYFSLFMANFLAAYAISKFKCKLAWSSVIVGLSLLASAQTIQAYYRLYTGTKGIRTYSQSEYQALKYLKQMPKEYIVVAPYDENSYITAFAGLQVFFADKTQTDILLIDSKDRQTELRRLYIECKHESQVKDFMQENNLDILYVNKEKFSDCYRPFADYEFLIRRFENEEVVIYERNF